MIEEEHTFLRIIECIFSRFKTISIRTSNKISVFVCVGDKVNSLWMRQCQGENGCRSKEKRKMQAMREKMCTRATIINQLSLNEVYASRNTIDSVLAFLLLLFFICVDWGKFIRFEIN